MKLPKIGDTITNELAIELCQHYGFTETVSRIKHSPDLFKPWVFDGASMVPDQIVSELLHIPNLIEIALRHDLIYAYGIQGDDTSKLIADWEFGIDLLRDSATPQIAKAAVTSVILFGGLPSPFCWGFARK